MQLYEVGTEEWDVLFHADLENCEAAYRCGRERALWTLHNASGDMERRFHHPRCTPVHHDNGSGVASTLAWLEAGEGLSLLRGGAEFDEQLTRCCIRRRLRPCEAARCWLRVAEYVIRMREAPPSSTLNNRATLFMRRDFYVGAFVFRATSKTFFVGLILNGTSSEFERCRSQLCDPLRLERINCVMEELPICRIQRTVSLHLLAQQDNRRIVPGAPLPTITAHLRGYGAGARTPHSCDGAWEQPFRAYEGIRLFLGRPVGATLRGRQYVTLPEDPTFYAVSNTRTLLSTVMVNRASSSSFSCSPSGTAACSVPIRATVNRVALSRAISPTDIITLTVSFTELSVNHTGEHLVCAEVKVKPSYRPFVAVLCTFIPPFLVVTRPNA